MEFEVAPEPTEDEREALFAALERLLGGGAVAEPEQYRSRWRLAALRENVEPGALGPG